MTGYAAEHAPVQAPSSLRSMSKYTACICSITTKVNTKVSLSRKQLLGYDAYFHFFNLKN